MLNWLRRGDGSEETGNESKPLQEQEAEAAPVAQEAVADLAPASIESSLAKTRKGLFGHIRQLFGQRSQISDDFYDELEELLIQADLGVPTTQKLVGELRERIRAERLETSEEAREVFKKQLTLALLDENRGLPLQHPLNLLLVVGVNGAGKTTSIAKLAGLLSKQNHRVMLAAGDTFRAAAIEQLQHWGERAGVTVISHQPGSDPGAVIFDAIDAAEARKADVVIADTAGRLHTKFNLMEELKKISRVAAKRLPGAPHEVLLVIDATTGQNAVTQARQFNEAIPLTGLILAKLDSTAKGGIVFAIRNELGLPIKFVGTGERLEDLAEFDAEKFVASLLD